MRLSKTLVGRRAWRRTTACMIASFANIAHLHFPRVAAGGERWQAAV
jgi:hypothetical protein